MSARTAAAPEAFASPIRVGGGYAALSPARIDPLEQLEAELRSSHTLSTSLRHELDRMRALLSNKDAELERARAALIEHGKARETLQSEVERAQQFFAASSASLAALKAAYARSQGEASAEAGGGAARAAREVAWGVGVAAAVGEAPVPLPVAALAARAR